MPSHGRYFKYFPTVPYETFDGSGQYKVVTDIFKRVRATLEARTDKTIYYNYRVPDGEKPEHVAYKYYGEAKYYWVVLLMNEIRDPQWCWPLDTHAMERFIANKYGSVANALSETLFYRTKQIKASATDDTYTKGDVILKAGIEVPSTFTYEYTGSNNGVPSSTYTYGVSQSREAVDGYTYEIEQNDARSDITLLRRNLLQEFVVGFENLIIQKR